jgi:hypothetical protein
MTRWTDTTAAPRLTDAQIVAIGMRTIRRYRPALGITLSSHIAAAKMRRLAQRSAS